MNEWIDAIYCTICNKYGHTDESCLLRNRIGHYSFQQDYTSGVNWIIVMHVIYYMGRILCY